MISGTRSRVFLSYARQDGEEFATALRRRIETEEPEITLWHDRAQLEGGAGWWAQVEAAIDAVKFLVIVMTPKAMASEMTRKEWRYARQHGVVVYPVKGVPDSLLDYSALPNWMRKAHFFDLGRFTDGEWHECSEWETFVNYLKSDRQPLRVPFMAPDLPPGFVPRREEFDQIFQLLVQPSREQLPAVAAALHGPGGYGKTTLAAAVCHDERIIEFFDDGVLWTSFGPSPQLIEELGRLYTALTGQRVPFVDVTDAASRLGEKLEHRNCLIVLDDVWSAVHLEPFLRGGRHSPRLVTTRRFDLVGGAARVRVDQMRLPEAVSFLGTAFQPGTEPDGLRQLARHLGEWPLLLKLAAGMIRKRVDRGDSPQGALTYVVRALEKRGVTAFDQSTTAARDAAVQNTVSASLGELSADDARRLRDLAIFPKKTAVPLATLERLWGLDDLDTVDCAQRLDDVSLLTLDLGRGVVGLHDVMRVYLLSELGDVSAIHGRLIDAYGSIDDPPDLYAWRWLPYHLLHARRHAELKDLLLRPQWLQAKLRVLDPAALIRDFELLHGDADLDVVQATLRLSLPTLVVDPTQLAGQLLARLPQGVSDRLEAFREQLRHSPPCPRLHARWVSLQGPGGALIQTLPHDTITGAVALSEERAVSWSEEGTLRLWDLTSGDSRPLHGHTAAVNGAAVLPDDRVVSWSRDGTLRIWDLVQDTSRVLTGHIDAVHGVAALGENEALSWSADGTLRTWDVVSGENKTLTGHHGSVHRVSLLSDEHALSIGSDGTPRVWNLTTRESRALTGHQGDVRGALLMTNGCALSWGEDRTLRVWSLETGDGRVLAARTGPVYGALQLPDGRAVSWRSDGVLEIWNADNGDCQTLGAHDGWVYGALLLSDSRVLSWSDDGTLRLWNVATHEKHTWRGHHGAVLGALVLPDGRVLSWSADSTLRVWDQSTGEARALTGHASRVKGALPLPDARVLSWGADGTLRVWNVASDEGHAATGHERWVHGVLLTSDDRGLSWSGDGTLRLWELDTGERRVFAGHEAWVYGALELPDGRALSWSADTTLRVWELATGESRVFTGHRDVVHGALLLSQTAALSWSADSTLRVWDLSTGESRVLTGHEDWVNGALLLPNGGVLSWSEDGTFWLWDLTSGKGRALNSSSGSVQGALLLPDLRLLSWGSEGTLRVWDVASGQTQLLEGHRDSVRGAISLPQMRALSWSADGKLLLWNLTTGTSEELKGHHGLVNGAVLLDDERIMSWSVDRTVRVWNLGTAESTSLSGHTGAVQGALPLDRRNVLSWSADRSIRLQSIDGETPTLSFYFDATPTVAVAVPSGGFLVGDALGRMHLIDQWQH